MRDQYSETLFGVQTKSTELKQAMMEHMEHMENMKSSGDSMMGMNP